MRFLKVTGGDVVDVEIPRRSIYVMQDEARYKYNHAIPPRKKDKIDGTIEQRESKVIHNLPQGPT